MSAYGRGNDRNTMCKEIVTIEDIYQHTHLHYTESLLVKHLPLQWLTGITVQNNGGTTIDYSFCFTTTSV